MKTIYQVIYSGAILYAIVAIALGREGVIPAVITAASAMLFWAIQTYHGYTQVAKSSHIYITLHDSDGVPQAINCSQVNAVLYNDEESCVSIIFTNNHCCKLQMNEAQATEFIQSFKKIANGIVKESEL